MNEIQLLKASSDRTSWIPLSEWCDDLGISSVTAWRYRRKGWLQVVRVGGLLFITKEALADFERRAAAGEFGSVRIPSKQS